MKTIIAVAAAVAALSGCAVQQPYYTAAPVQNPYEWHTVSVVPAGSTVRSGTWTEELPQQQVVSSQPTVVYTQPTYTTVVTPAPVYYAPAPAYYYPPVSIGLDFSFGHWCCRWGGRGYYRHR